MDVQLSREFWTIIFAIGTSYIIAIRYFRKHKKAILLTKKLLERLPLWVRMVTFGDRAAVPSILAKDRSGDYWISHNLIALEEQLNEKVFQCIEQHALASRFPLISSASFASAAITLLLLFVFYGLLLTTPTANPAAFISGPSHTIASVGLHNSKLKQLKEANPGGKSTLQESPQTGEGAKWFNLIMPAGFLLLAVGIYCAFFLIGYIKYVLPNLIDDVIMLCDNLGLVTVSVTTNGTNGGVSIVSAEEDPVYKQFSKLK